MNRKLKISDKLRDLPTIRLSEVQDLQGDLKTSTEKDGKKLINRIRNQGFKYPLFIWFEDKTPFMLDGNQRKKWILPAFGDVDLPYVEIEAENRIEAKKEILAASSHYGKVTQDGFDEFTFDFEETDFDEVENETTFDDWMDIDLDEEDQQESEEKEEKKSWVPDCLFPSNNIYEIPTLDLDFQGEELHLPFEAWGEKSRYRTDVGTYHFYVDDYRFQKIWDYPDRIADANVLSIVEPNLSLFDTTPVSYGLHLIYKKRWISRYLQGHGVRIFVDMNVSAKFYEYNILGVPEGYNAFCTRGYSRRMEYLKEELEIAKRISQKDQPNMVIYGGGLKIREFCAKNNLIYVENLKTDEKWQKQPVESDPPDLEGVL